MASTDPARPIVLVGMMGAGKSTVGPALAEHLHREFLDLDAAIEADMGCSIAALFLDRGEAAFRVIEEDALEAALGVEPAGVIAAGGGAVLSERNRRVLSERALTVWLVAPADVLAERVGAGVGRPLLGDDPATRLAELLAERRARYEAVADAEILTVGSVEDTVEAIEQALEGPNP